MRPSTKPTGEVWRLLKQWSQGHPLKPNQTQMAGLFGVSTSLLSNWKFMESTMQADEMALVAESTGIDIAFIAKAVADDKRNRGDLGGNTTANTDPGSGPDPALIVKRYLKQNDGDPVEAASILAHDGAKGSNTDEATWFAALEQLANTVPAERVDELPDGVAARRNQKRPPRGPDVQGAD